MLAVLFVLACISVFFALYYHRATIQHVAKGLYFLTQLPPGRLDAFLRSYELYDRSWTSEMEREKQKEQGPRYVTEVGEHLAAYYGVMNHLCALGPLKKMYIPPDLGGGTILENQHLFEDKLRQDLEEEKSKFEESPVYFELGCGRGAVARDLCKATGATFVGLNIDLEQLKFARNGVWLVEPSFHHHDFNDIPWPFENQSFHGAYEIQALSLAINLKAVLKEVFRVLKPGARFICLDWMLLPAFDEANEQHIELLRKVKPLIGAVGTYKADEFTRYCQEAGFEVSHQSDLSEGNGGQSYLIKEADRYFTRLRLLVQALSTLEVVPKRLSDILVRFNKDGKAFIQADEMRLVTTSYYIILQKPETQPAHSSLSWPNSTSLPS